MPSMDLAAGISAFQQAFNAERGRLRQQFLEDQQLAMERQRLALEQARVQAVIDQMGRAMSLQEQEYARGQEVIGGSMEDQLRQRLFGESLAPAPVTQHEAPLDVARANLLAGVYGQQQDEAYRNARLGLDQGQAERDMLRDQMAYYQMLGGPEFQTLNVPGLMAEAATNPMDPKGAMASLAQSVPVMQSALEEENMARWLQSLRSRYVVGERLAQSNPQLTGGQEYTPWFTQNYVNPYIGEDTDPAILLELQKMLGKENIGYGGVAPNLLGGQRADSLRQLPTRTDLWEAQASGLPLDVYQPAEASSTGNPNLDRLIATIGNRPSQQPIHKRIQAEESRIEALKRGRR